MKQYTKEEVIERYKKLPKDLQTALSGTEVTQKLQTIAQNHHLHIDQLGALINTVKITLAGLVRASEFVSTVKEVLKVDQETAYSVASAVNTAVFLPLRSSLREISQDFDFGGQEAPAPIDATKPLAKGEAPTPAAPSGSTDELRGSIQAAMREQLGNMGMAATAAAPKQEPKPQEEPILPPLSKGGAGQGVGQISFDHNEPVEREAPAAPKVVPTPEATAPEVSLNPDLAEAQSTLPANSPTAEAAAPVAASITEDRLAEAQTNPEAETDMSHKNANPLLKMIPQDVKERINNDPYKESID